MVFIFQAFFVFVWVRMQHQGKRKNTLQFAMNKVKRNKSDKTQTARKIDGDGGKTTGEKYMVQTLLSEKIFQKTKNSKIKISKIEKRKKISKIWIFGK